ncbi:glycosyltransferase [Aerococcaceae bacterium zg-B36]|uniref:glycosyltransferase n=1 Tax=Aerococcaceae bacterium zg-252 TaxID=2796928 RepID=UPI001BD909DB|nr:glycosyltransferase [Aerococcaceae bacterium zg-B36]
MKILQVTGSLNIGGLENVAANIMRYGKIYKQMDFLIYEETVRGYEEELIALGAEVIMMSPPKASIMSFLIKFFQLLKKGKYDAVIIHTYTSAGFLSFVSRIARVKKIVVYSHTSSGSSQDSLKQKLYKAFMKVLIALFSTDRIAVGEKAGQSLYLTDYKIIENGIAVNEYEFSPLKRGTLRKELGIQEDDLLLGHVGRLSREKNQVFLLELMNHMNKDSNIKLMLIGEGDERLKLENLIKQYHLEQAVILVGSVPNPQDYYHAMDVFVFPSLYEGIPLAMLEAQLNGLPVVASNNIDKKAFLSDNAAAVSLDDSDIWTNNVLLMQRKPLDVNLINKLDVTHMAREIENILMN